MSTLIRLRCEDQKLRYVSRPLVASGSHLTDTVSFELSEEWAGYLCTAVFYRDIDDKYLVFMGKGTECEIPSEVMEDPGSFYIGVFGNKDGLTKTSSTVICIVDRGAIISVGRAPDPTPDVYSQIVSMIEAGMLKGDKGDPGDKGDSGVWVGSGEMPNGYNVQVDPQGTADGLAPILSVRDNEGNVRVIDAIRGSDGKSSYDIALENGFKGTEQEWLASLQAEPINPADKSEVVGLVLKALPTWSGGEF